MLPILLSQILLGEENKDSMATDSTDPMEAIRFLTVTGRPILSLLPLPLMFKVSSMGTIIIDYQSNSNDHVGMSKEIFFLVIGPNYRSLTETQACQPRQRPVTLLTINFTKPDFTVIVSFKVQQKITWRETTIIRAWMINASTMLMRKQSIRTRTGPRIRNQSDKMMKTKILKMIKTMSRLSSLIPKA